MAADLHRSLSSLRRQVRRASYLGTLSSHALVALLIGGAVTLLLRTFAQADPTRASLALLVVLLAPITAWIRTRTRGFSTDDAATYLDVRSGGSGDLVTALELDDPRWTTRTDEALTHLPAAPRLRLTPISSRLAAGLAFVLLAMLVPVPARGSSGPGQAIYRHRLADVREKLETLEEEIEFDDETLAELQARLERVEAEAEDSENPEAMFESIAELGDALDKQALEAQDAMEQAAESLDQVAAGADSDPQAAQTQLEETLAKLDQAGLTPSIPKDLAEELGLDPSMEDLAFPEGAPMDPSALKDISEEMRELLAEKMAQLAEAGLLDGLGELGDFGQLGDLAELGELGELFDLADLELCEDCKAGEP